MFAAFWAAMQLKLNLIGQRFQSLAGKLECCGDRDRSVPRVTEQEERGDSLQVTSS